MRLVASTFGLHPLAVEDVLKDGQRPKLDSYDCGPFIVWIVPDESEGRIRSTEIDIFLGKESIVTCHSKPVLALDQVAADVAGPLRKGSCWVLHAIVDHAVDELLPIIDRVGDEVDTLEDRIMRLARKEDLQRLQYARRRLRAAHRVLGPERDVLRGLVREEAFVTVEAYRYFQDVGDHLARAEDALETVRDIASGAMDIYLSAVSNNLNVVMKRLTVVATIFMPGTLIAGVYGMNFQHMPELAWRYGYLWAWGLIVLITGSMLYYFKRSDWW
jgi:magnesium transporter